MTESPNPAAAHLESVSKLYGTFAALRNVSVEFPLGSSTVVLGDNGAGKSTMLRLIAGLITPSRGQVSVFSATPQHHRHRIAYMSHDAMLYDELSAIENLHYFAKLHANGGCACSCTGSPEMALRAVGLDPTLSRPVGQYSQGMRQRASLARVLQTDPELLLLDEPFSNLDVDSARHMVELLLDFRTWPLPPRPETSAAEPGGIKPARTIILTTHQAHLAEPLADTTLTMRSGAIVSTTHAQEMAAPVKAAKPVKTNAARLLDSLGIAYELRTYEVNPDDLTAISVARKIGLPAEQVFKTLLTRVSSPSNSQREPSHLFAVIPGDTELDLKKLALAASVKKIELASLKDVEPLTGYIRGGVTVLAARTGFPAYADETIELHDVISISAGQRGLQLLLTPADYLRAAGATLADLTKPTHAATNPVTNAETAG